MVFSEYIQNLPNQRQDTIEALAELTCSTKWTVLRWVNGTVTPPPVKQKMIAEYLGSSIEVLFPKHERKNVSV